MDPSDDHLTTQGLEAEGRGRLLLIACGALAHEILALKRLNGWDHMDLQCLPAKLHLYPDQITEEVEKSVLAHRHDYDRIFVVYADCGTGGKMHRTGRRDGGRPALLCLLRRSRPFCRP